MNDIPTPSALPPFLRLTEPLEPEQIPLQVALLTMELAQMRTAMQRLAEALDAITAAARAAAPDLRL
jgi:hypothetical protein